MLVSLTSPQNSSLPHPSGGSAPHQAFRGLLSVYCSLRPAHSLGHLVTLCRQRAGPSRFLLASRFPSFALVMTESLHASLASFLSPMPPASQRQHTCDCSDCYRLERKLPGGFRTPLEGCAFITAHRRICCLSLVAPLQKADSSLPLRMTKVPFATPSTREGKCLTVT